MTEKFSNIKCPVLNKQYSDPINTKLNLEATLIIDESEPTKIKGIICPEYKTDYCKIRYDYTYNPCIYQKPNKF